MAFPIGVEEDVIGLSVILLDEDYFNALQNSCVVIDGVSLVDQQILIPFKARAFLDLSRRKANGEDVRSKDIKKHRNDIFRLVQLLPGRGDLVVADTIRADLAEFLKQFSNDPNFDYSKLKLPISLTDAKATLVGFYRLDHTDWILGSVRLGSDSRVIGCESLL